MSNVIHTTTFVTFLFTVIHSITVHFIDAIHTTFNILPDIKFRMLRLYNVDDCSHVYIIAKASTFQVRHSFVHQLARLHLVTFDLEHTTIVVINHCGQWCSLLTNRTHINKLLRYGIYTTIQYILHEAKVCQDCKCHCVVFILHKQFLSCNLITITSEEVRQALMILITESVNSNSTIHEVVHCLEHGRCYYLLG